MSNLEPQQTKDNIFASAQNGGDFVFDEKVANVFQDMISRSVPGYATILSMIAVLAKRYCVAGSNVYDLGCSLGGASIAMAQSIDIPDYRLIALDNSEAMIAKFRAYLADNSTLNERIELRCADILDTEISSASVVVLNFTLQFIPVEQRGLLLSQIYGGMKEGGILILSEKIVSADPRMNELLIDAYHSFKQKMGYSELEISQKRSALENVLIPESVSDHRTRLSDAGFRSIDPWFQCFNFASFLAIK